MRQEHDFKPGDWVTYATGCQEFTYLVILVYLDLITLMTPFETIEKVHYSSLKRATQPEYLPVFVKVLKPLAEAVGYVPANCITRDDLDGIIGELTNVYLDDESGGACCFMSELKDELDYFLKAKAEQVKA